MINSWLGSIWNINVYIFVCDIQCTHYKEFNDVDFSQTRLLIDQADARYQPGSCLTLLWWLLDPSGRRMIFIRQPPDGSGICLISIWWLPDWSGSAWFSGNQISYCKKGVWNLDIIDLEPTKMLCCFCKFSVFSCFFFLKYFPHIWQCNASNVFSTWIIT